MSILQQIRHARSYFSWASPRTATRQAARLIRAKHYLQTRGIDALAVGSKFQYSRATGSVLGQQS